MNRGEAADRFLDAAIPAVQLAILMGYVRHQASSDAVEDGTSWPSVDLLCRYTGASPKTVTKHRQELVDAGVLVVVKVRPCNVLECRIDFGALESIGIGERGKSASPGERGGWHDCGTGKTAEPERLPKRFWKDCGSGSGKTADEPSSRTLFKNPLHSPNPKPADAGEAPSLIPEPEAQPEAESIPEPTGNPALVSAADLGTGLTPAQVHPGAWSVFSSWKSRQARPDQCKLTKARHRLLKAACQDYETADLLAVVALAYDAPIGTNGLPESYRRSWREDGPAGLEMLLRRQAVARNVEMAQRWKAAGARKSPTSPSQPSEAARYWWRALEADCARGMPGHRVKAEARYGAGWWAAVLMRSFRAAGFDVADFERDRQYMSREEKARFEGKRGRFLAAFEAEHAAWKDAKGSTTTKSTT